MKLILLCLLTISLVACGSKDSNGGVGVKRVTLAKENDITSMDTLTAVDGMSFEVIAQQMKDLQEWMQKVTLYRH